MCLGLKLRACYGFHEASQTFMPYMVGSHCYGRRLRTKTLGKPMFHELLGPIQLDWLDTSEGAEFEECTGVHHRLADGVCRYSSTV